MICQGGLENGGPPGKLAGLMKGLWNPSVSLNSHDGILGGEHPFKLILFFWGGVWTQVVDNHGDRKSPK